MATNMKASNGKEEAMTAFNTVRFRIKPGKEQQFLDAHQMIADERPGLRHVNIIKAGEDTYCLIAEWCDAGTRPNMIATLNSFRKTLLHLGGGLGVTDLVAGPVILAVK